IYGLVYWLTNLARALGTVLGSILFAWSFAAAVALAATLAITGFAMVAWRLDESWQPGACAPVGLARILREYRSVLRDRRFAVYVLAGICDFGVAVQLASYVAVRLASEFPAQHPWPGGPLVTGVFMFAILRMQGNG